MILNPEWLKPKEKPYFHQISLDCLKKLVACLERFNKGEIDADTSCKMEKQILTDEIDDPELLNYAVENISELFGYIATERVNIRIHKEETARPQCFLAKSRLCKSGSKEWGWVRCGLGWGKIV